MAEVAATEPGIPIPAAGSLAFFLDEGAVVHVPAPTAGAPTDPPADALPVLQPPDEVFPERPSPWARTEFPYWPVEATALDLGETSTELDDEGAEEDTRDATLRAVASRFQRRQHFFSAKHAYETLGLGAVPLWWHGVQSYAEQLKIARFYADDVARARRPWLERARAEVERLKPKRLFGFLGGKGAEPDKALEQALKELHAREAQDADFKRQKSGIGGHIEEVERFAAGRKPWTPVPRSELEEFSALFERGRTEFKDIARRSTWRSIDELATDTLLAMMTGDERAFAAMPEPLRDFLNLRYRLPTNGWHQMFGVGVDIQGNAACDNEGNHLLLQLVYDDMVGWHFGDMGAFQFWISPGDLAARNWSGVKLTFECH